MEQIKKIFILGVDSRKESFRHKHRLKNRAHVSLENLMKRDKVKLKKDMLKVIVLKESVMRKTEKWENQKITRAKSK